jgi:nucleoside-diphosphate-sugar epimerase
MEPIPSPISPVIILAGATGDLGLRITRCLLQRGASVRALVRKGSGANAAIKSLQNFGATIVEVDYNRPEDLIEACSGGSCLVSALSGLREVIVETQTRLLAAAVKAGVPRFIPSDYSIDFTRLPRGTNRNLDLRREFHEHLDRAPIAATTIFNGMFTDLLTGEAPLVQPAIKRVIYWGSADQPLDFTTIDNTADFTAAAALDPHTPRFLRIAGEVLTIRGLKDVASKAMAHEFRLLRVGGLRVLAFMINFTRRFFPQKEEVFPAWQGMQYMHNMLSGLPKLEPLDNDRYPDIKWKSVEQVLAEGINN